MLINAIIMNYNLLFKTTSMSIPKPLEMDEVILEIWDDTQNMKKVWKVKNLNIVYGVDVAKWKDKSVVMTRVHCTIIMIKKNKTLTSKIFAFEWKIDQANVEQRIKAYYIAEWVLWKQFAKLPLQYYRDVFEWKRKHDDPNTNILFEIFDAHFRFLF